MTVDYDVFGGMLLERLRICVERGMSADEIILQLLDVGEAYAAFTYGEVMARRARFVYEVLYLRCANILTDIQIPALSVNVQDEHDRHLQKMADKAAMECKGMSVESAQKHLASGFLKSATKYMETTTGRGIDASAMAFQIIDYALHMSITLLGIEKDGIDLERIFSYGDEGNTLRARLTGDDHDFESDADDEEYIAEFLHRDV